MLKDDPHDYSRHGNNGAEIGAASFPDRLRRIPVPLLPTISIVTNPRLVSVALVMFGFLLQCENLVNTAVKPGGRDDRIPITTRAFLDMPSDLGEGGRGIECRSHRKGYFATGIVLTQLSPH